MPNYEIPGCGESSPSVCGDPYTYSPPAPQADSRVGTEKKPQQSSSVTFFKGFVPSTDAGSCAQVFANTVSAPVKELNNKWQLGNAVKYAVPIVVQAMRAAPAGAAAYVQQVQTMISARAVDASESIGPLVTVTAVGAAALEYAPVVATGTAVVVVVGTVGLLTYGLEEGIRAGINGQCHW